MSGRPRVTSAGALLRTRPGRRMLLCAASRSRGHRLYRRYAAEAGAQTPALAERLTRSLLRRMREDASPASTQRRFADEVGSDEFLLSPSGIDDARARLSDAEAVSLRVGRLLDSKFVAMTLPVLCALYDAAAERGAPAGLRDDAVGGHIVAIDLSEPMDRIADMDEDLEYLDDYRLMCPYMLEDARESISRCGEAVLASFEAGFAEAREGQAADARIRAAPLEASEADMAESYKKYRAVMGTAGRNMAMGDARLGDAFYTGMAGAAECVGCGNEIEDSVGRRALKVPSWPLYDSVSERSARRGLARTREREAAYMERARSALAMLPDQTRNADYMEFLFLAIDHYNAFWHSQIDRALWDDFEASLDKVMRA